MSKNISLAERTAHEAVEKHNTIMSDIVHAPIDAGIITFIEKINMMGAKTTWSCQGYLPGWRYPNGQPAYFSVQSFRNENPALDLIVDMIQDTMPLPSLSCHQQLTHNSTGIQIYTKEHSTVLRLGTNKSQLDEIETKLAYILRNTHKVVS